ncbi:MAG: dTDP-4-dehydrorhamnose reductase family protein [Hyphomicrobiaceae bacterium]
MKVVVLGANGMIGSTALRVLSEQDSWQVFGTIRSDHARSHFPPHLADQLVSGVDLSNPDALPTLFADITPNVVVNCAGLTKHVSGGNDPVSALNLNALLPHRLVRFCRMSGARLIHVSTDCVFSGKKGNYSEHDQPDATDIYGKTKHLGEVVATDAVTLRTSTIGHELGTRHGLLEWFLSQTKCKGYRQAIFSGLPTVEFARVVRDVVIPDDGLSGLYHVGAKAIDKDSLLRLVAKVYERKIDVVADDTVVIDRSLDSENFSSATGYRAPDWPELIAQMRPE